MRLQIYILIVRIKFLRVGVNRVGSTYLLSICQFNAASIVYAAFKHALPVKYCKAGSNHP